MPHDDPTVRELAASIERHAEALEKLALRWDEHLKDHKGIDMELFGAKKSLSDGMKRFDAQDAQIEKIRMETKPTPAKVIFFASAGILGSIITGIILITLAFAKKVDNEDYQKMITETRIELKTISETLVEIKTEQRITNATGERMSK